MANQLTKKDIVDVLKEVGVVTKRDLKKTEKKLYGAISNVAINSPTDKEFNKLENRVKKLESYHNYA